MQTTVVIPTKNEKESIGKVISKIKSLGSYDILVVDNSFDGTDKIAKKAGARVIKQNNGGKGNAMILGAENSKENIVFVDGDLSYDLDKIPKIIELSKEHDIVRAVRKPLNIKSPARFVFNVFMSFLVGLVYGKKTKDLFTGLFSIKKKTFLDMNIESPGFGVETEIFIKSAKKDLDMVEIQSKYFERKGKSKVKLIDSMKILMTLLRNIGD